MKPTCVRLLATITLALAATLATAQPVLAEPSVQGFVTTSETKCREQMANASLRYLERVLIARMRCEDRIIDGRIPPSTNCRTGVGDAILTKALSDALDKLTNSGAACQGVDMFDLSLPGKCPDTTGGSFTTLDLQKCILLYTNIINTELLDYYYPPFTDFIRGLEGKCMKGSAKDAARSLFRVIRARQRCLIDQEVGLVADTVDCRAEIQPYGPGTGDADVDRAIGRAYVKLLGAIPVACVNIQVDDLDYQSSCIDPTGGAFTIYDLKTCFFHLDNDAALDQLGIVFPTEAVCGDGIVGGEEQCDDGLAGNSNTTPNACRKDCKDPVCHDGVTDNQFNEQCDDGNTNNTDCCVGECVNATCGDGTKNCNEECDLGAGNANQPDTCRKTGAFACKNPKCGDTITDPGNNETCDDGNTANNDGCNSTCKIEVCGDGVTQPPREQCDNGANNANEPDKCRATGPNACKNPKCGDVITDPGNNETCDDGNTNNTDACRNNCTFCGDDHLDAGEECDDGVDNSNAPNKCRLDCKNPICGDSITDDGEICDDGNSNNNDGCSNVCTICGDGILTSPEECDGDDTVCGGGEACNDSCVCDSVCPVVGELTLYASYGKICTSNADCAVGTCDPGSGYCRTSTRLDSGWTGAGHASDINDASTTRGFLQCEGHGPVCGECNLIGVDPSTRACRCSNNTRTVCDEPFSESSPDCPTCVGGSGISGLACAANGDCQAGPCQPRCIVSLAPCTAATAATDCPGDTCSDGDPTNPTYCANGNYCSANSDCTGTCSGQSACDCYFGAPFPLNSGGTPACIVNRFAENVSGTANVDLGAGEISATLRTRVYLGPESGKPCPTCGGRCTNNNALCTRDMDCTGGATCAVDPTADDGVRGGFCVGGQNNGMSCDVTGVNSAFPAFPEGPNGGGYSLDCLPDLAGTNLTGQGLLIKLTQTTGTQSLSSNVSCGGMAADQLCPCMLCSGGDSSNPLSCNQDSDCTALKGTCTLVASEPCSSNADCASIDIGPCVQSNPTVKRCLRRPGVICTTDDNICKNQPAGTCKTSTCSSKGRGVDPRPNKCNDGLCSDLGGGIGECTTGPDTIYCDGIVRPDGNGVYACSVDEDCYPSAIFVDGGNCTLHTRNGCFFDPVVATGTPSPSTPIGASVFCIPPVSNTGVNTVAGLPGPGRILDRKSVV